MSLEIDAPGKLFLFGEYAVLEGAPALVAAVDRRARVRLIPRPGWTLTAPQLGLHQLELGPRAAPTKAPPASARLGVFQAVIDTLDRELGLPSPHSVNIDTAEFFHGADKLGFGSSAAVTVALLAGLAAAGGHDLAPAALFELAAAAHARAQGGAGSQADIAAAVYGGVLEYVIGQPPQTRTLPAGLDLAVVHAGQPASTPALIGQTRQLRARDPALFRKHVLALGALSRAACDAWTRADVATVIDLAHAVCAALERFGDAADAAIVDASHRELRSRVQALGAAYKPSGAGGGDIGLALAPAGHKPLANRLRAAGIAVLGADHKPDTGVDTGVDMGAPGVTVTQTR